MNRIPRFVVIAVALAALAGCGNKGPLVLPSPPADAVQPAESDVAEPATTEPAATEPAVSEPAPAEPAPVGTDTPVPATPPAETPPTEAPPPPDHGDHG